MPLVSAGPQGTENVVGCGCVLYALLFIRASDDREGKHIVLVAPESLRGPTLSHARQVACPPRVGPHKPLCPRPRPASPMSQSASGLALKLRIKSAHGFDYISRFYACAEIFQ